jgi:hypothetical protein
MIKEDEGNERTIEWILDSGCGCHLTGNASLFSSGNSSVTGGDDLEEHCEYCEFATPLCIVKM